MPPTEKEKSQKLQEKFQAILSSLLREEENKYCVDCDAKGPRWASWNLGVFLCIRCAGIHRNLGVHISRVKSVNLDQWTAEQIASMQAIGNSKAREIYEKNLPDNFRRSQNDSAMEQFIRAKYEQKKWIAKDWTPPSHIPVSSDLKDVPSEKKKASTKITLDSNILPVKDSSTKQQVTNSTRTDSVNNVISNTKTENISVDNGPILLDFDIKETTSHQQTPAAVEIDFFNATFDQMNINESNKNETIMPDFTAMTTTTNTVTSINNSIQPTSPTSTSSTNSDFNTLIFTSTTQNDTSSKKIDKNSILALYSQSFGNTNPNGKPTPTMGIQPTQQQQLPPQQQHFTQPGHNMSKSNSFYSTSSVVNSNHQAGFGTINNQFYNYPNQPQNNHFKANNFIPDQFSNLTPTNQTNTNTNSLLDDFFGSSKPSGLFN